VLGLGKKSIDFFVFHGKWLLDDILSTFIAILRFFKIDFFTFFSTFFFKFDFLKLYKIIESILLVTKGHFYS